MSAKYHRIAFLKTQQQFLEYLNNLGISLPGTGEDPKAPVYVDGKLETILRGENMIPDFVAILDKYVASHYPLLQNPGGKRRS